MAHTCLTLKKLKLTKYQKYSGHVEVTNDVRAKLTFSLSIDANLIAMALNKHTSEIL